jgi:hypothetical protein
MSWLSYFVSAVSRQSDGQRLVNLNCNGITVGMGFVDIEPAPKPTTLALQG